MPVTRSALCCLLLAALSLTYLAPSAVAYAPPGRTSRVSVGAGGLQLDGQSGRLDISSDGRYVVFGSTAMNASDLDGIYQDVYFADRFADGLELVTIGFDGTPARGDSQLPRMSNDGGVVAFSSSAPNLVEGDTNGTTDAFYWNRETGEIRLASITSGGAQFDAASQNVEISGNGRFVTFNSRATNVVDNPAGERLIFVHDTVTGVTESATHTFDGTPPTGPSFFSALSDDGRYVAYESYANNITADDGNPYTDCFVYDRVTGTTKLVSLTHQGGSASQPVSNISISGNGLVVAFQSSAALVPDVQGVLNSDIYVRDLVTDELERVSVTSKGYDPNGSSTTVQLGHDGRFVMFSSRAVDLAADERNGNLYDSFIHDRMFGTTELLSESIAGGTGNNHAFGTGMSADARFAAVYSVASDLVVGDSNEEGDSFVRDRGPQTGPFDLSVEVDDTIRITGAARSGPVRLAEASHAELPVGAVDLRGADVSFRSEEEDLFFRLDLGDMRNVQGAIAPGSLFGFDLETVTGRALQIRAHGRRVALAPDLGLYECSSTLCERVADLDGGVGVTGSEVIVSVPVTLLDAKGIASASAWFTAGDAGLGPILPVEKLDLGSFAIPEETATAGIAPSGTALSDISFTSPLELHHGALSGSLDAPGLATGTYDVWARTCVGDGCGFDVTTVALGGDPVELESTELFVSAIKDRSDVVLTATLVDAADTPIEGKSIGFLLNGAEVATATTDSTGVASVRLHRNLAKKGDGVTVFFDGDDSYSASTAQTQI